MGGLSIIELMILEIEIENFLYSTSTFRKITSRIHFIIPSSMHRLHLIAVFVAQRISFSHYFRQFTLEVNTLRTLTHH